jgi:pimeloyl-ACP methyl ester carboxylesterase
MWGTPDVWLPWRDFLHRRGFRTLAPALRHHDAPPLEPPAGLGATSLADYVADLETEIKRLPEKPVVVGHSMGGLIALLLCARGIAARGVLLTPAPPSSVFAIRWSNFMAFSRIQLNWGWWHKPHRPTEREALAYTFNTTPEAEARAQCRNFVHESGRALLEIALPWLDGAHAASVRPREVKVPLLFVGAQKDLLVPPDVVRRTAAQFSGSVYREYPNQGHWVLGQPGWQNIAEDVVTWLS